MDLMEKLRAVLEEFGFRKPEDHPKPAENAAPTAEEPSAPAELLKQMEEITTELAALRAEKDEALKREAQALAAARQEANERKIESLKASFRITPATGDKLAALASSNPEAFDLALPIFESLEPLPQLSGTTISAAQVLKQYSGKSPADEMHELTLAKMKDNQKLSYSAAMRIVSQENPELAAAVAAPKTAPVVEE